jgi:hypothetical protein
VPQGRKPAHGAGASRRRHCARGLTPRGRRHDERRTARRRGTGFGAAGQRRLADPDRAAPLLGVQRDHATWAPVLAVLRARAA